MSIKTNLKKLSTNLKKLSTNLNGLAARMNIAEWEILHRVFTRSARPSRLIWKFQHLVDRLEQKL